MLAQSILDCNDNGIHDPVDVENGVLSDANGDGLPDECFNDEEVIPLVGLHPRAGRCVDVYWLVNAPCQGSIVLQASPCGAVWSVVADSIVVLNGKRHMCLDDSCRDATKFVVTMHCGGIVASDSVLVPWWLVPEWGRTRDDASGR